MKKRLVALLSALRDVLCLDEADECRQIYVMLMGREAGVWIPIPDARRILTVRDLKRYLALRLDARRRQRCPSQRAFHRLRTAILSVAAVDRSVIRPRTRWRTVLPLWSGRRAWRRVESAVGQALHPLIRSASIGATAHYLARTTPAGAATAEEVSRAVEGWLLELTQHRNFTDDSPLKELLAS